MLNADLSLKLMDSLMEVVKAFLVYSLKETILLAVRCFSKNLLTNNLTSSSEGVSISFSNSFLIALMYFKASAESNMLSRL
jgi:hypothetical protein